MRLTGTKFMSWGTEGDMVDMEYQIDRADVS